MGKKLMLVAMAIAAMAALAVPAASSAAELVFTEGSESGKRVPVGEEITGTSNEGEVAEPLITETETLGFLSCEKIMLGGTLAVNDGTTVSGSGVPAQSSTTNCAYERGTKFEKAAVVKAISLNNISSTSAETGTGTFEATFIAEIPGETPCHFETIEPGVFHYAATGSDLVTVTRTALNAGGCGEAFIEGEGIFDVHRPTETLPAELR